MRLENAIYEWAACNPGGLLDDGADSWMPDNLLAAIHDAEDEDTADYAADPLGIVRIDDHGYRVYPPAYRTHYPQEALHA